MPHRATTGHNIGELLLREGLISNEQLDAALARQRETDLPLVRILVEAGTLDEAKRLNFFKRQFGVPTVSLNLSDIDAKILAHIPVGLARKHHLVPVRMDRDGLVVAMEDPSDLLLLDSLKEVSGERIKPVLAHSAEILAALDKYPATPLGVASIPVAERFDPAVRLLSWMFLPIMSTAALAAIAMVIIFNTRFQGWLQDHLQASTSIGSQYFSLFLYFFLSWGVWTILMWEIQGLVFDDLEWKSADDVGEPCRKGTALGLSVVLGLIGIDRLYLGYRRMFLIKALTLGLFGIWWILDIVLLLFGALPDAAGRSLA